jgi:hypothetical protein
MVSQQRVRSLGGSLDVVRVVVLSVDDEELLQPSDDA